MLLCLLLAAACHNRQTGQVVTSDKEPTVDKDAPYVEGNKKILQWENEEIDLFVKRYGWDMTRTGTGLRIQIVKPGEGECFQEGDLVTLDYETFLLSGERVYNGEKSFTVGRSEEITGLHEAAQLLRPGSEARLVVPSHLAYGVAGDGDQIKGRVPIAMIVRVKYRLET